MGSTPGRVFDERYARSETKIQGTIDIMFKNKMMATKVTDFCTTADINPATFYKHYKSIGDAISWRDFIEVDKLKKYLNHNYKYNSKNKTTAERGGSFFIDQDSKSNRADILGLKILFRKTFQYIIKNKAYFEGATARNNVGIFKGLMDIMKPTLFKIWQDYHKWDHTRDMKLNCVYYKLTYEIIGEYNEWIEVENFDPKKIEAHVKGLIFLSTTAPQRLERYIIKY